MDDGEIDKEEEQILKDIESIIAHVEAQIAAKKTGSTGSESRVRLPVGLLIAEIGCVRRIFCSFNDDYRPLGRSSS